MRRALCGGLLGLASALASVGSWAADSDFLEAREAFRAGDTVALADAYQRMSDSPLRPYAQMWLLWRSIDTAEPAQIEAFLRQEQGQLIADKLRERWLQHLAESQQWDQFLRVYEGLIDRSDVALLCAHWQARLATERNVDLRPAIDDLWLTDKDLPEPCKPVQARMIASNVITTELRWQRVRIAMEANKPGLVKHLLDGMGLGLSNSIWQQLRSQPQTYIRRADMRTRLSRELAAYAYGRWARDDMASASEALYKAQGRLDDQAPWAWRQVAMAAAWVQDPQSELWFLRSRGAAWTDRHWEARLRMLVREGSWAKLIEVIEQLPAALQEQRAWRYWLARAQWAAADEAALAQRKSWELNARKLMAQLAAEEDYYGLLARESLGQTLTALAQPVKVDKRDAERLASDVAFQRAFALQGLGLRWESVSAFNWAVRMADDTLKLAAAAQANRSGWYDRAIYAAERTSTRHEPRFLYLTPYRREVNEAAEEQALDEAWVYGLMRQESRFVSAAQSHVGANGLMQLMPATARWVAKQLNVAMSAEQVQEPQLNIRLGSYYLKHLDDMLGHKILATAGYNAGPRRAKSWQADKPLEAARYIESIPFPETRDYVKKVMANAIHYARLFNRSDLRLSDYIGVVPAKTEAEVEGP